MSVTVRYKSPRTGKYSECFTGTFVTTSLSEVVCGDSEEQFLMDIKDLEFKCPDGSWKPLSQAFRDKDIVPNNYNTHFGPPKDDAAKERGYNW